MDSGPEIGDWETTKEREGGARQILGRTVPRIHDLWCSFISLWLWQALNATIAALFSHVYRNARSLSTYHVVVSQVLLVLIFAFGGWYRIRSWHVIVIGTLVINPLRFCLASLLQHCVLFQLISHNLFFLYINIIISTYMFYYTINVFFK